MTAWLLAFGWNWLFVPVGVWFVRGVCIALWRPRVTYLEHTQLPGFFLFNIRRQELLPPWRSLDETWLFDGSQAIRESDGKTVDKWSADSGIFDALSGHLKMRLAREKELEILTKVTGEKSGKRP